VALTDIVKIDGELMEGLVSNSRKLKMLNVEKKRWGISKYARRLIDLFYIYPKFRFEKKIVVFWNTHYISQGIPIPFVFLEE
jgi:hypothetical protein